MEFFEKKLGFWISPSIINISKIIYCRVKAPMAFIIGNIFASFSCTILIYLNSSRCVVICFCRASTDCAIWIKTYKILAL